MSNLHTIWKRLTSTRTENALREEIARLRAENRALLNSIQEGAPKSMANRAWGSDVAGIPPVLPTTFTTLSPADGHSESPTHSRGGDESPVRPTSSSLPSADQSHSSPRQSETRNDSPFRAPSTMSPIRRRRSWHQINRMLELESAQKTVTGDS